MTEYEQGYLQGLRDALVAADGQPHAWQCIREIKTLLTNYIHKFKK